MSFYPLGSHLNRYSYYTSTTIWEWSNLFSHKTDHSLFYLGVDIEGLAVGPFLLLIQKTHRTKRSLRFLPFSDLHQIQDRCKRKQACPPKMTKRLWKKDLRRDFNQHVTTTAKFWIMSLVRQSFRNILKLLV